MAMNILKQRKKKVGPENANYHDSSIFLNDAPQVVKCPLEIIRDADSSKLHEKPANKVHNPPGWPNTQNVHK
jgi:hypothetical protein